MKPFTIVNTRFFASLLLVLVLLCSCSKERYTFKESELSIAPKPSSIELGKESFLFSKNTTLYTDDTLQKPAASFLSDLFKNAAGYELPLINSKEDAAIIFSEDKSIEKEGYRIVATPQRIVINANDAAGYFYAVQTIRQLLPAGIEITDSATTRWLIPSITINDAPRFTWRGMHMDFSRHFFSIDEVKTFLDYMALYKLNTYHMHLTDDQGWRIEIKKYPLLTENGAWRSESTHDKICNELAKDDPSFTIDKQHYHQRDGKKMYGGFFTQDQIKEIIHYAAERQIEVIPEIDMPGHFKSAIDNYPFLSCTDKAGWGETFSIPACLGKETSYEFVKDVLDEVAALFPSRYIHIGGDEVNTKPYKACPHCQNVMQENDLKNEHELQSYFNRDIEAFLKNKGKKLIGWDEIVEGGLSKNATMMWWRNWAPTMRNKAADNGNNMVICPDFEYYFDFKNQETPLEKVYAYEPIPKEFTEKQANYIIGVQANLWSEWIPNFKRLEYQAFPRIMALAETAWSKKENKNFNNFTQRVALQYERLDMMNIRYYIPPVGGLKDKMAFVDKAVITLESPLNGMQIFYTLDGTTPTQSSLKYTAPIEIIETTTLNSVAYRGSNPSSLTTAFIEKQSFMEAIPSTPKNEGIKRWVNTENFKVVENVTLPNDPTWEVVNEISLTGYKNRDQIAMIFKGYFLAEQEGIFEFATKSDDGSMLYIGDKLVVDNGGNHGPKLKEGMIALKKGWHPIKITYYEAGGGEELKVWYVPPAGKKETLKEPVIRHD